MNKIYNMVTVQDFNIQFLTSQEVTSELIKDYIDENRPLLPKVKVVDGFLMNEIGGYVNYSWTDAEVYRLEA